MYLSAFRFEHLARIWNPDDNSAEILAQWGIGSILVTNALLLGPVLALGRRWQLPPGTATILFTAIAVLSAGLDGFDHWPLALAGVIGGAVADLAIASRRGASAVAIGAALTTWLSYFLIAHLTDGLGWSAELWSGTVVLTVVSTLGLVALTGPGQFSERSAASA